MAYNAHQGLLETLYIIWIPPQIYIAHGYVNNIERALFIFLIPPQIIIAHGYVNNIKQILPVLLWLKVNQLLRSDNQNFHDLKHERKMNRNKITA